MPSPATARGWFGGGGPPGQSSGCSTRWRIAHRRGAGPARAARGDRQHPPQPQKDRSDPRGGLGGDRAKARIGELLAAVERRLASCGFGGLAEVVDLAGRAAVTAGLVSARVTGDAEHAVEIGLTDKSDAARSIAAGLWRLGVGAGQVLVLGDEFGALGEVPGSDSLMRIDETHRSTFASVGPGPARECRAG